MGREASRILSCYETWTCVNNCTEEKRLRAKTAERIKHLEPELIEWRIAGRKTTLNNGQVAVKGMVICKNRYGSEWTMSVSEFDSNYKTR